MVKNNQDNDLNDNKRINLYSVAVNREPCSDNELANKKYIDDEVDKNTILRFNQTLENYLKVSVGSDTYNLTIYDKIRLVDITFIKHGNGAYLLPRWKVVCKNKNNIGLPTIFIRATKTVSPTSQSGATVLPPFGNAFIYIETSSNNHGHERVFVSWERTDIIHLLKLLFIITDFQF